MAGTETTARRAAKAATANVLDVFGRPQDAIIEVAEATAQMIEKAGSTVGPDRVKVEFRQPLSGPGTLIIAGAAGEASPRVTLGHDRRSRVAADPAAAASIAAQPNKPLLAEPAGGSP